MTALFLLDRVTGAHIATDEKWDANLMQIYLFQSASNRQMFGFTLDPIGKNLPVELAPWHRAGRGTMSLSKMSAKLNRAGASDASVRAIEDDGFFLARAGKAIIGTIH